MSVKEFLDFLNNDGHCETKEDFIKHKEKALEMFAQLPKKMQDFLVEDENVFEPISMIISAFEYEEENSNE